ncbi:DUF2332 domain-containing protein [Dactylosporangium sp. NPDC051484]|uniref:DUF2332 domain-containing protein n=1 Tax=Dactylosporangium sp. NPDC051484 TaxID=3154942 RepID=UPI0034508445
MSRGTTTQEYRFFATAMARGSSPLYERLALGVAGDAELIDMLDGLPPAKRQPNLLFAAARHVGGTPGGYAQFRDIVLGHRDAVVATMLARRTQTNEAGRCAALYPVLAALPQPLTLLEVGASAGLCLLPDRYSYEYTCHDGTMVRAGAADGAPRLHCRVEGAPPAVGADAVRVAWRAGVDLNPLDVTDEDDVRWLRTLVWPEQLDRLARLDAALEVARRDPPRVVAGDLNARLDELVAEAGDAVRAGATLVVFHTAVLDYVPEPGRGAFVDRVRRLDGHWLSQERPGMLPRIDARLPGPSSADTIAYVVSLDERPLAFSALHGAWLRPLSG